jgi:hypothetical protein
VFERPGFGRRYLLVVDPATGRTVSVDPDNHGILVLRMGFRDSIGRWHPMRVAARATDCGEELTRRLKSSKFQAACRWELDVLIPRIIRLHHWYGDCIVCPEVNRDPGLTPELVRRGIPVYRQLKYNRADRVEQNFYGFDTTDENRDSLINNLNRLIRNQDEDGDGIMVEDSVVVQELRVFIRKANGRTEAMGNWHDDNVMALAIGASCEDQATLMKQPRVVRTDELSRIEQRNRRGVRDLTYT